MKFIAKILLILLTALALFACRKKTNYPTVPKITYKSFTTFYPDSAILTINCKDNEGDIGLKDDDTTNDLFLEYYEYINGVRTHIDLPANFYYHIDYIPRVGKDKALNADISVNISPFYYDITTQPDSFAYSIQLEDRDLHKSNIVFTPPLLKGQ